MRFSIQPEPRPEQQLRTVSFDEILAVLEGDPGEKPALEHYFSPSKKDDFIKDFLHYLNSSLLDARHGQMDSDRYLLMVMLFQFTSPLLEIPTEKELGLFYRILQKTYKVTEIDLNLHFSLDRFEEGMVGEAEALEAFRNELGTSYDASREVKEVVQKRLKRDAIEAIMKWQKNSEIPALAESFGRSVVLPSFFSFQDKKLISFYRNSTNGIQYKVAVPAEIE